MAGASWAPGSYDERKPFGRCDAVVGGDNVQFSKERWEAIKAVRENRATPEQIALVHETDQVMREAMDLREAK